MKLTIYSHNIQSMKNPKRKINLLKFINKFRPKILCLQETNVNVITDTKLLIPNYTVFYNSANAKCNGTAICVSNTLTTNGHTVLYDVRMQKVSIEIESNYFTIYNVHLSHSNAEAQEMIHILDNDLQQLPNNNNPILIGDWNYVDNPQLDTINHLSHRSAIRNKMQGFLTKYNMIDTFRNLFPDKIQTTHTGVQQHKPKARLDRSYITGNQIQNLTAAEILPSFSDHGIVSFTLVIGNSASASYWKMKLHLLHSEEFLAEIKNQLNAFINSPDKSFDTYENLKFSIKKISMEYESIMNYRNKYELLNIKNKYSCESCDKNELFLQMVEMRNSNAEALFTDYQNKKIKITKNDIEIEQVFSEVSRNEIGNMLHEYFERALKRDTLVSNGIDEYLSNLPKISHSLIEFYDSLMTSDEINLAITKLGNDTCPGLDGIISEFYKIFKQEYTIILKWLWEQCVIRNILPPSLRKGVVKLIYKKDEPKNLKNWRPITMSNTDFKIFAIVLKNRFTIILSKIIGPWQTCGIPGRSIYDNISFLRDNMEGTNGAIVSIDQESAFPNVDHGYMFKVLKAFGFPVKFVSYIALMYKDISVHVSFGSNLTKSISFEKGVKQGDPMANCLFILCIEPLIKRISQKMLEIKNSPFPSSPLTNISAYADDITPFISDISQLTIIENELKEYGNFSGGRVNWNKCEIYPFGNWNQITINTRYKINREGVKILGIYYGNLSVNNWESLLSKFKSKLTLYKSKSNATSLSARAKILNTFVLPVIWYHLKVLQPPELFLGQIQFLCENYLWEGKRHWLKRPIVYAPRENGGLGVRSPIVQIQNFRIRAIIKSMHENVSKYFLKVLKSNSESILFSNHKLTDKYYESIRLNLNRIKFQFLSLPVNLHSRFSLLNPVIFRNEKFDMLKILRINDIGNFNNLISSNPILNIRETQKRKLNIEIQKCKRLISDFMLTLTKVEEDVFEETFSFRAFCPLKSKIEEITTENAYFLSFFSIFPYESLNNADVNKLKSKNWKRLNGTKLSTVEMDIVYRFWNKCLITFKIAKLMNLISTGNCAYCQSTNPDVNHLAYCKSTDPFWNLVWLLLSKTGFRYTRRERIYGYDNSQMENSILFLALITLYKRFLYNVNSGKLDYDLIKSYKQALYEKIYIDFIIARSNHKLLAFMKFWKNGLGLFKITNESTIDIRL